MQNVTVQGDYLEVSMKIKTKQQNSVLFTMGEKGKVCAAIHNL